MIISGTWIWLENKNKEKTKTHPNTEFSPIFNSRTKKFAT